MVCIKHGMQIDLRANGLNVPVLNPLPLTIRVLAGLIEQGYSLSKAAYPMPKDPLLDQWKQF